MQIPVTLPEEAAHFHKLRLSYTLEIVFSSYGCHSPKHETLICLCFPAGGYQSDSPRLRLDEMQMLLVNS
jgi:hypothetical protein